MTGQWASNLNKSQSLSNIIYYHYRTMLSFIIKVTAWKAKSDNLDYVKCPLQGFASNWLFAIAQ